MNDAARDLLIGALVTTIKRCGAGWFYVHDADLSAAYAEGLVVRRDEEAGTTRFHIVDRARADRSLHGMAMMGPGPTLEERGGG